MSSIDQVIARSRATSALSERKTFSVARSRAIQKMRRFALASPFYFALELIQAAVANGATYIDITAQERFFALAYVGGGFAQDDLAQLFDFLFAAKSDMTYSALRQLALGVNALMRFEPKEIVIVSGDGTEQGTSQITIRSGEDMVEVGRPAQPLRGTFVRASGMDRKKVPDAAPPIWGHPLQEVTYIRDRCLAAPVPLLVNDDPIFGYSSVRHPQLYGYDRTIKIDEGDLYGTLGLATVDNNTRHFKLLTYGVFIQSFDHVLVPDRILGGTLTFDRLNKTADHAAVVRDERLMELWARLLPYARQLIDGRSGSPSYHIFTLQKARLSVVELRQLLDEATSVVCVEPSWAPEDTRVKRATQIAQALPGCVVLRVPRDERETLRYLAAGRAKILQPELASDHEVRFFEQPPVEPPERPWLLDSLTLPTQPLAQLLAWLERDGQLHASLKEPTRQAELCAQLGGQIEPATLDAQTPPEDRERHVQGVGLVRGELSLTLYTPLHFDAGRDQIQIEARVICDERLVWSGRLPSAHPGYVLDISLRDAHAIALQRELPSPRGGPRVQLAEAIAQVTARQLAHELERASARALEAMMPEDVQPGSMAAWRVLAAVAREGLLRLRRSPQDPTQASATQASATQASATQAPTLTLSLLRPQPLDLLALPTLTRWDGQPTSLRQITAWMEHTGGLIYGVMEEVKPALDGLDTSRVLRLTQAQEGAILAIFGEAAYVRLDARDFLATTLEPLAHVRDVAQGLKAYSPGLPLLIEHAQHERWSQAQREDVIQRLVKQLVQAAFGPHAHTHSEEDRRQALRHVQRFAVWRVLAQSPDLGDEPYGVEDLPLFVDHQGRPMTLLELMALAQQVGLTMSDGHAHDDALLRAALLKAQGRSWRAARSGPPSAMLAMNPYVYHLLRPYLPIGAAFDFDLHEQEQPQPNAQPLYLVQEPLDTIGLDGHLGVPAQVREDFAVLVTLPSRQARALTWVAQRHGVVGSLRLSSWDERDDPEAQLAPVAQKLLIRLLEGLGGWPTGSPEWTVALHTLLRYAAQSLTIQERPDGHLIARVQDALAQRILELPLFDAEDGMPASAQRLIDELCSFASLRDDAPFRWRTTLSASLHPLLNAWLEQTLHPSRVFAAPARDAKTHVKTHAKPDLSPSSPRTSPQASPQASPQDEPAPSSQDQALIQLLEAKLAALRPDDEPRCQVKLGSPPELSRAKRQDPGPMSYLVLGDQHTLLLHAQHPQVQRWRELAPSSPEEVAWMLLAAYALINERRHEVTNAHELAFQAKVLRALADGQLRP